MIQIGRHIKTIKCFGFLLCRQSIHTSNFSYNSSNHERLPPISSFPTPHAPYIISDASSCFKKIINSMLVYDDFISDEEEQILFQEVEPKLKKLRYEHDHWDDAINGYREIEKSNWNKESFEIFGRIKSKAFSSHDILLPHIHVLDLHAEGSIKPHIDSIKFCGEVIAGLSLLSSCVMRFSDEANKETADVFLKKRSLYVMSGPARYEYRHEILGSSSSYFNSALVPRERRISAILRTQSKVDYAD